MRWAIAALIAVGLAIFGWLWFQGDANCDRGRIFETEAQCAAVAGFDAAWCRDSFSSAKTKSKFEYAPFPNENDCLLQFPRCEPHGKVSSGFVPVPRAVCVTPKSGDPLARPAAWPIYERYGQRIK